MGDKPVGTCRPLLSVALHGIAIISPFAVGPRSTKVCRSSHMQTHSTGCRSSSHAATRFANQGSTLPSYPLGTLASYMECAPIVWQPAGQNEADSSWSSGVCTQMRKTLDPLGRCGISKLRQKMAVWASPSNAGGAQSQHMQWLAKPVPLPSRSPHVNFLLLLMERPDPGHVRHPVPSTWSCPPRFGCRTSASGPCWQTGFLRGLC